MKFIPCPSCRKTAVGPPSATFPKGVPIFVGRFTSQGLMTVKCAGCKKAFRLDAMTFHALPEMTQEELRSVGRAE